MKKLISLILCLILCLSLFACNTQEIVQPPQTTTGTKTTENSASSNNTDADNTDAENKTVCLADLMNTLP